VIAERHRRWPDRLASFVTFAGDQQHVAKLKILDGASDRLATICDLLRARGGGEKGSANYGWILIAWIVVGDNDAVRPGGRDRTHQRTLAAVAVAAGTENQQ
jgi:hypothetical protein